MIYTVIIWITLVTSTGNCRMVMTQLDVETIEEARKMAAQAQEMNYGSVRCMANLFQDRVFVTFKRKES